MFRAIVETQWKWMRGYALIATIFAFVLPLGSLQSAYAAMSMSEFSNAVAFVSVMQSWGVWYALLAAALGLCAAFTGWSHDHRGRHVYALILPVSRARYVMMRLGAGALFMLPAVVALLLGGIAVAVFGQIPEGLHVYAVSIAIRFALAALVSYALFFTVASATSRAAGIVLGAIAALFLIAYLGSVANLPVDFLPRVGRALFESPGVLSVFTGRWMLIDA
jgi:hypothetical protein